MIETAEAGSALYRNVVPRYLQLFFDVVVANQRYFQWMEVLIDWVIKVA